MKKPNLLALLLIVATNFLFAQSPSPLGWLTMMQEGSDYESIISVYDAYYSDPNKQTKDHAFHHYNRWRIFWQNRQYSSPTDLAAGKKGLFYQTTNAASNYLFPHPSIGGQNICNSNHADSDWENWGFDEFPRRVDGVQFKPSAGMGIVTAVAVDPTDNTNNTMYAGTPNAGVWKTTNGGDMWQPLMENLNVPGLSVDDIAINPKNGNNLLASTGVRYWRGALPGIGVLQSRNGGTTWEPTDLLFSGVLQPNKNFIRKVAFHPVDTNKLYAAIDGQIRLSIDHGVTWDSVLYDAPRRQYIYEFKLHPTNPDTMYISTAVDSANIVGIIARTFDGGNTWTEVQTNIGHAFTAPFYDITVSPQTPDYLYATTQRSASRGWLFKSRDNGNTWVSYGTPLSQNRWNGIYKSILEVSPTDSNIIIAGGINLLRSLNAGVSFQTMINRVHDDMRSSTSADGLLVLGTDGGVSTTTHQTASEWESKYTGLNITDFHGHDVDESFSYLIGGCQDVGLNRYDIKNQEWLYVTKSPYGDGGVPLISDLNPNRSIVNVFTGQAGQNDYVASSDAAMTYNLYSDPNGLSGVNEYHLATRPIDQDRDGLIYVGYANVYKRSLESGGLGWTAISDFIGDHQKNNFSGLSAMAVAPSDPNVIIVAYEKPSWNVEDDGNTPCPGGSPSNPYPPCDIKKVFITTNGGATWQNISEGLRVPNIYNGISDFAISPTNPNHIWVTFGQYVGGQRVFYSSDQGQTWSNQSYNLPPVPVNSIAYQPHSNDRIFVGTDVGVYTKEGSATSWDCYNEGLPTIACTDLDINECANKLTVSTFGRGIFSTDLPTVQFDTEGFDTISGNVTWSGTKKLYRHVYIDGELTITGTVKIAQGKGFVVSPTSVLTIDGGEIDAFKTCNDTADGFWKGIELVGDYTKSHHWLSVQTYHAKLVMKGGATLRNARHGVMQWRAGQYHTAGSLIEIENSNFINCHKAIEFMHHTSEDRSFIRGSNFLIDADYRDVVNDTLKAIPQITLWSVRGVEIQNCNFENNSGYHIYDEYRDHAIFSIDAGYDVISDCADNQPRLGCATNNVFKNFSYGIHAIGSGTMNTVTVDRAEFYHNSRGAAFEGIDNVRFSRNLGITGDVLKLNYPASQNYYNLKFDGSSGYRVEHNDFESVSSPVKDATSIFIKNSGIAANEIYYNSFKRFNQATHYQGINKADDNFQGFQGICNWSPVDGGRDILIDRDPEILNILVKQGIRFHQGTDPDKHLDNIWSISPTSAEGHIRNQADPIWYYHKNNGTTSNPKDEPLYYSTATVTPKHIPTSVNSCPLIDYTTGKINGDDATVVLNDFDFKKLEYDSLLFLYLGTIDGGNSDSMLQTMNLNLNPSALQLRDQLLAQSPYVSTSMLMQVAQSDALGDLFLLEVCLANPAATQSAGFLDFLEFEIPNPLSSSSIQLIYNNWDVATGRTLFEQDLAGRNGELGRLFNWLMHYYKTDYANDRYNDIVDLYEKWPSFEHKCRLIELAMERNDFSKTTQIFNEIDQNMTLSTWNDNELTSLHSYVNLRKTLFNSGRTIWEATPSEVSSLRTIADGQAGRTATLANNLACYVYGSCHTASQQRRKAPRKRIYVDNSAVLNPSDFGGQAKVELHPNPASDLLFVQVEISSKEQLRFELVDLIGRISISSSLNEGKNNINVATVKDGSYIVRVYERDQIIHSAPLVIQH